MRKKNSRHIILQAATELFHENGYADTSIRDVADKANIASSVIYHYFENKEHILFDIIRFATIGLINTLTRIDSTISDPKDCIQHMFKTHVREFGIEKHAKVVISDTFQLRGKRKEQINIFQREIFNIYDRRFNQLKKQGLLKDVDTTVAVFGILGSINSVFRWYRASGRLTIDEIADNIAKSALYGILVD